MSAASPGRVLLFAGHRIDAPGRAAPRFPAACVGLATQAIAEAIDASGAAAGDLALTQGAAGGDLLFAEACASRGLRVRLMLPFAEAEFVERSILPSQDGAAWHARWRALRERLADAPRVLPEGRATDANGDDAFERCNAWMLDAALAHGAERLSFICLWDGAQGDGPGGTAQMIDAARRRGARVRWLDTRSLW